MGISYLNNKPWNEWSREERLFCAVLYEYGRQDPKCFARWLINTASLDISTVGDWELGYEVCFYRDFLWQRGMSVVDTKLPPKRTFDLCLFGEKSMVIIEAKVFQGFELKQNEEFAKDRARIKELDGLEDIDIYVVALASSTYLHNAKIYSRGSLEVFDGSVSWLKAASEFKEQLFDKADSLYKGKPSVYS